METTEPLRHAILGAGGVGLLLAAALAREGLPTLLLLRSPTLAAYDGVVRVESAVLGDFDVPIRAAPRLDEPVDVLWLTTKAPALEAALRLAPPARVGIAVPLLNGFEHLEALRRVYPRVAAASISVESGRIAPGRVRQTSPFARLALAPEGTAIVAELRAAGLDAAIGASEAAVLWDKLAVLAPLALATTAADAPFGAVLADPGWRDRFERCRAEVCAVAAAEGAPQDAARLEAFAAAALPAMRSSLQKDVAAGRPSELDAIGGAVVRAARTHGVPVPATEELVAAVASRIAGDGSRTIAQP